MAFEKALAASERGRSFTSSSISKASAVTIASLPRRTAWPALSALSSSSEAGSCFHLNLALLRATPERPGLTKVCEGLSDRQVNHWATYMFQHLVGPSQHPYRRVEKFGISPGP